MSALDSAFWILALLFWGLGAVAGWWAKYLHVVLFRGGKI